MLFQPQPKKLLVGLSNNQIALIGNLYHSFGVCSLVIQPLQWIPIVRMKEHYNLWQFTISVEDKLRRIIGDIDNPLEALNADI